VLFKVLNKNSFLKIAAKNRVNCCQILAVFQSSKNDTAPTIPEFQVWQE
jgi:hypothetical protein